MEDLSHLVFLAINSKEIVEKQVDSNRQQHPYAGTIIGATALYIPLFLSSLDCTFLVATIRTLLSPGKADKTPKGSKRISLTETI